MTGAPVRFKVRLRICPHCGGLAYPMGWPPDTSSLKAAKHWQKVFGDWPIGRCGTCDMLVMPFGWPPQKADWSRLVMSG